MARSARGHERAHVASLDSLAKTYAPKIARCLRSLVDVQRAVRVLDSREKAPSIDAYQQALAAVRDASHRPAPDFEQVMQWLYEQAYVSGSLNASQTIGGDAAITFEMTDWQAVAELMGSDGGRGLRGMLDEANVVIKSIEDTYLDQLATVLANGMDSGASTREIANDLEELLLNPERADMIARTETARAQTVASLDEFRNNGMGGKQAISSGDSTVCELCQENEDVGPVALDEEFPNGDPPVHPNCECAVVPVLSTEMELYAKMARADAITKNAEAVADKAIMVGWFLPLDVADALALPTGEPAGELHITLVYCGKQDELPDDTAARLCDLVLRFAQDEDALLGHVSGAARFISDSPDGEPIVALADVPGLGALRAALVRRMELEKIVYRREHDFCAHITVAYAQSHEPGPEDLPPPLPLYVDRLCVTVGGERYECLLRDMAVTVNDNERRVVA